MTHLNFETVGNPQHPSVMLLHGFMSSNAQWLANIDALSGSHHLVMVELWGHGQSPEQPDENAYSTSRYIGEFERIRTSLGIARWAVIGQSYGAGLVIRYALACADVITHVVVTNSRSAFGDVSTTRDGKPQPELRDPNLNLRELPFHPINARRFPEHIKSVLVASADAMSPETVRLSGRLGRSLNCMDVLGDVSAPVLIANGVYEKVFQADAETLRARYPTVDVVDMPGGHSVNIEAADAFNTAVVEFLV